MTTISQDKRNSSKSADGFTLVELLVVITLIVILMALLFPAFRGVQEQAKSTQAKNDLIQIVTAISAFYTEYGRYPCTTQNGDDDSDYFSNPNDSTQAKLFSDLRGISAITDLSINPKLIAFIQPPLAKDPTKPKSGIGSATNDGKYYDPWGAPYRVKLDSNYNNELKNLYTGNTGAGTDILNIGVIVWSLGKDGLGATTGAAGNGGSKASGNSQDDVISWQ